MFDLPALIEQCAPNVSPVTMQAVMRVESGFRPYTIGYHVVSRDGKVFQLGVQPANKEQAVGWAKWMLDNGYKFDAGMAQINSTNFARYGLSPETVFEPCTNIRTGARILTDCYTRALPRYGNEQAALRAALSCYNSGNFRTGFGNGYVAKVTAAAGAGRAGDRAPPLRPAGGRAREKPMTASTTVEGFGAGGGR